MKADLNALQQRIGYTFRDIELLTTALTHSSYANERKGTECNERMEFLGDAVLGLIAANHLYHSDRRDEGALSKRRAEVVCSEALASYARTLELGPCLRLGRGEEMGGGAERTSNLENAFEAVVAAIYLDGGMEPAEQFVLRFIIPEAETQRRRQFKDYKTALQEIVQQNPGERLEYVLSGASGPDHNKTFVSEVHLNSNVIGVGRGRSKKESEQQAAREALKLMGYE